MEPLFYAQLAEGKIVAVQHRSRAELRRWATHCKAAREAEKKMLKIKKLPIKGRMPSKLSYLAFYYEKVI